MTDEEFLNEPRGDIEDDADEEIGYDAAMALTRRGGMLTTEFIHIYRGKSKQKDKFSEYECRQAEQNADAFKYVLDLIYEEMDRLKRLAAEEGAESNGQCYKPTECA